MANSCGSIYTFTHTSSYFWTNFIFLVESHFFKFSMRHTKNDLFLSMFEEMFLKLVSNSKVPIIFTDINYVEPHIFAEYPFFKNSSVFLLLCILGKLSMKIFISIFSVCIHFICIKCLFLFLFLFFFQQWVQMDPGFPVSFRKSFFLSRV